jgi:hypothetical protein
MHIGVVAGFIPASPLGMIWAGTSPAPTRLGFSTAKKPLHEAKAWHYIC